MSTSYLIAGNLTVDALLSGWRFGGSVAYCTLAARRLGVSTRVVTSYSPDTSTGTLFQDVEVVASPSDSTTAFRNTERHGARKQELLSRGGVLSASHIPKAWTQPDILHLAPVFQEIDVAFIEGFRSRLCGATLQGWARAVDDHGRVVFGLTNAWDAILALIDIAIFSNADLNHSFSARKRLCSHVPLCVETLGRAGCRIIEGAHEHNVPTDALAIDDTTGAGDVFAAAFLARYFETGDPVASAQFANRFAGEMLTDPDFREKLHIGTPTVGT